MDVKDNRIIFAMTAPFTRSHVREHAHIGIPIITYTYDDILVVPLSSVIKQFSLGGYLAGIMSDVDTNLVRCKAIL